MQIGLKTPRSQLLKRAGDLSHKPEIKEDLKAHLISTLHRAIDTTLLVRTILIDRNLHIFISKFTSMNNRYAKSILTLQYFQVTTNRSNSSHINLVDLNLAPFNLMTSQTVFKEWEIKVCMWIKRVSNI